MKKFICISLIVLLTGCFGPATFDASTDVTIKESAKKIIDDLPENQRDDFQKAMMYFTMGGSDGFKSMMGAAFAGKEQDEVPLTVNLKTIDGLTGLEILDKHKASVEADRIKREKEKVEREKVNALKKEAEALLGSQQFQEAIAKYNALSEISSGVEAAEIGIQNTNKAMSEFTEKMNYIGEIEITEFTAKRIDTYSKKGVPAVRISLKNNGNRSLDKVKVVVYFQNESGQTIFEEAYHPINVSPYSFGDNKALKAGYIKEMEADKYYTLDSNLSEWVDGKATAKIVDIEFSES